MFRPTQQWSIALGSAAALNRLGQLRPHDARLALLLTPQGAIFLYV